MTNSEAIRQLNSLIDNSKSFIDGDSDDIWERDIEALNIAKVSLQEQAEREKGCEHCDWNIKSVTVRYKQNIPNIGIVSSSETYQKPQFCPMCGRKLVEE